MRGVFAVALVATISAPLFAVPPIYSGPPAEIPVDAEAKNDTNTAAESCREDLSAFDIVPSKELPKLPSPECERKRKEALAEQDAAMPTVERLMVGIEKRPWADFYMLAAQLMGRKQSEENAGFWFYVGQMRGRAYVICHKPKMDGHPALLASLNSVVGPPINEYLGGSVTRWVRVIDKAIAWHTANPDPALPASKCAEALKLVRDDKLQERKYILDHVDEIREGRIRNGLANELN